MNQHASLSLCCSLSNLVSLELRENILKTLPQSISFLVNLERLDLGANELTELVSIIACTYCAVCILLANDYCV